MRFATLIGTAGLLLGTNAWAQHVSYDYDKSASFAEFKTYAWVSGGPVNDDFNHQRIVSAIDSQLAAKGVRRAASVAEADLLVTYHAVITRDVAVSGSRTGVSRWASARAQQVPVGSLIVDLTNATSRAVVWRGVATRDLDLKATPEQREKNINRSVEKLFKHYPPAR